MTDPKPTHRIVQIAVTGPELNRILFILTSDGRMFWCLPGRDYNWIEIPAPSYTPTQPDP